MSEENLPSDFSEKLDVFLTEGWSWADWPKAKAVFDSDASLARANIFAACVAEDPEAVRSFLSQDVKLAKKKGGPKKWPPILYACWSYRLPKYEDDAITVIRLLLEHGADPNAYWKEGWNGTKESALYGCVDANCHRAAGVMLEAGANPNDGESLYHACEKYNLAMLETLGKHSLSERDISYCIKHAMDFRWSGGIRWFLDQGADPNAVHAKANETSLHWAVKRNCSLEVIRWLLDAGADPNARTKKAKSAYLGLKGKTPLDFAARLGRKDVASALKEAGAIETKHSVVDRFVIAAANGDRLAAEAIQTEQQHLFTQLDEDDRRLVAHVAQAQSWDGVQLMVELGWKPDQEGGWMGGTPLHWAVCHGEPNTVDFLLSHGANASHDAGGYFRTPLNTLLRCRWNEGDGDYSAVLQRLLMEDIEVPKGWFPCGHNEIDRAWSERSGFDV